jgi:hypothetical protein
MDRPTPRHTLRAAPEAADDDWRDPIEQRAAQLPQAPAQEPDPEPTDEESLIARLRAGTGRVGLDKLRIKVFRRARGSADLEFCADYLPGEFEGLGLEGLRDAWGAGSYEIRAIGPRGIAMREQVILARREQGAQAQPAPQLDALAQVLAQLAQGQARIVEALTQRPDPQAAMRDTLALMVSMREAMGLNQPTVAAPATNPTAMLADIVGAVRQLREVSAELSPPAADPESPMTLLPQVLELVKAGMTARQGDAQVPQLTMPESLGADQPLPPAASQETAPEITPDMEEPMDVFLLRSLLARLLWQAQRNANPATTAELLLDHAPDELLAEIQKPGWWEVLAAVAPALAPHRAWVEQVRAQLLVWLAEDDQPLEPASGPDQDRTAADTGKG